MKYKVFKFENGIGETWYQILECTRTFYFFPSYSWTEGYYRGSKYTEPRRFNTEKECHEYMKHEEEYEEQMALRKQIKITELP